MQTDANRRKSTTIDLRGCPVVSTYIALMLDANGRTWNAHGLGHKLINLLFFRQIGPWTCVDEEMGAIYN